MKKQKMTKQLKKPKFKKLQIRMKHQVKKMRKILKQ